MFVGGVCHVFKKLGNYETPKFKLSSVYIHLLISRTPRHTKAATASMGGAVSGIWASVNNDLPQIVSICSPL